MKNFADVISEPPPLRVSIIIDNFNYDRFLNDAISSALSQTYPNCEVIVVDDGSTDNSREILKSYTDRVIVLLKENGGQASAFNLGFEKSTGDLITFLDSDDMLFPQAIQTAVESWDENCVKLQFPLEILDRDNRPTGLLMPRNPLSDGNVLQKYLLTGRYVTSPTSGNMFSRSFIHKVFPIPDVEWAQTADGYINTCVPFFGPIKALRQPLGHYRIHGRSMSSVSHDGFIDIKQMEKLITHAMLEKALLEKLAAERGHIASPKAVIGHWMHLKLRLAFYKLADLSWFQRIKLLVSAGFSMIISILRAGELSIVRKLQNIVWTIGVIVLPSSNAQMLIRYAFDQSPTSAFSRLLRRT